MIKRPNPVANDAYIVSSPGDLTVRPIPEPTPQSYGIDEDDDKDDSDFVFWRLGSREKVNFFFFFFVLTFLFQTLSHLSRICCFVPRRVGGTSCQRRARLGAARSSQGSQCPSRSWSSCYWTSSGTRSPRFRVHRQGRTGDCSRSQRCCFCRSVAKPIFVCTAARRQVRLGFVALWVLFF